MVFVIENFDSLALCLFTKFNNFLPKCCILPKNLDKFVSLPWQLDNPSCHNLHSAQSKCNCLQRNGTKEGHITSRVGDYWMRLILGRATMNDDNNLRDQFITTDVGKFSLFFDMAQISSFFSLLKVSKSRKQILKFSFEPKTNKNVFAFLP